MAGDLLRLGGLKRSLPNRFINETHEIRREHCSIDRFVLTCRLMLALFGLVAGLLLFASGSSAQEGGSAESGTGQQVISQVDEADLAGQGSDSVSDTEDISSEDDREIEQIRVTGRKITGGEDAATASSVTSFDASDLQAIGAGSVADLAAFTPNLEIISPNPTAPSFFIRGVGLSDFNANSTGAVAVFYDEVAMNSAALQLRTLFDVGAVNVLRGPQGSGPSRNASAGAIKVYSRPPSGTLGGYIQATYGNYNFVDVEGAVETPIYGDLVSGRLAFRMTSRDGFALNRCGGAPPLDQRVVANETSANARRTGPAAVCNESIPRGQISPIPVGLATEINDLGNWAVRGILRFQPDTLGMDWTLNLHGGQIDQLAPLGQQMGTLGDVELPDGSTQRGLLGQRSSSGYRDGDISRVNNDLRLAYIDKGLTPVAARNQATIDLAPVLATNLDAEPRTGDYNRTGSLTNDTFGVVLRGDMMIFDDIEFSTITAFETFERSNSQDIDNSPDPLFEVEQQDSGWQFSQDFRFNGEFAESLRWESGAYLLTDQLFVNNKLFADGAQSNYGSPRRIYSQETLNVAAYFGLDWDIWEDLTFDGGIRLNWEEKSMEYSLFEVGPAQQNSETVDWLAPTGSARLTYHFDDTTDAFAKFSHGWKSGHFNPASSTAYPGIQQAQPEEIDAWETGFQGAWFDYKLGLTSTFFYYRYNNYQVFTFIQGFNQPPELTVINANDAQNYGAEVALDMRPVDDLFLSVTLGWLESKYLDFTQENAVKVTSIVDGSAQATNYPILIDNSGNRLTNSPELQVTLSATYHLDLGRFGTLIPRYDGAWKSETFFDPTEGRGTPNAAGGDFVLPEGTLAQSPFWLHNFRLEWVSADGSVTVGGWVKNAGDQLYKSGAFNAEGFGNFVVFFVGDPRTWGVDVRFEF